LPYHQGKRPEKLINHFFFSSTEHELEDQVNEWANMTGFLLALGGVCLQRKSPAGMRGCLDHSKKAIGMLPHGSGQDIQYCPVTQFLGQVGLS